MKQSERQQQRVSSVREGLDAAHKRELDLKLQRYQDKLDSERAFFHAKILTLTLLTTMAIAVWSLSTEGGQQVCRILSEIFR